MSNVENQELVAGVTHSIVAAHFPQELPLFRAQSEAYFDDPQKALRRREAGEDMLAFGGGEAVTLITPVALAVVAEVVNHLLKHLKETLKAEGEQAVESNLRHLFKQLDPAERDKKADVKSQLPPGGEIEPDAEPGAGGTEPDEPPSPRLSSQQIETVRGRALEKALALDLPQAKAELLADALAGSLRAA